VIWHLPYTQYPAIPVSVPPLPTEPPLSPLPVSLSGKGQKLAPAFSNLILLNELAVIPCQNSHLYSIHGPSVMPGGDTQCSLTAQCSPACSPASALQSSLSLYTSSLRTSSRKGSIRPLKTNATRFTCHRCDKLPGLSPEGCADS